MAFRMGVDVQGVSENLEFRDVAERSDTWAYVLHNVDPAVAQEELDAMHSREEIPDTGKVFVSAVSRTSVTVSGPPARLKALFNKSEFFRASEYIAIPVFGGLCHAPHIYGKQDTKMIVNRSSLSILSTNSCPLKPVWSTSTGSPYSAKDPADLWECVVSELLTQAICWDNVVHGVVDLVKRTDASEAVLYCFGNSIALNDLNTALASSLPQFKVSITNLMPRIFQVAPAKITPRSTAQSKLAIVSMSCRLPGGATDTERFWMILEDGLDVSQRIPADRFDIDTHYDPTDQQLKKSMTQYGCFIEEPGACDAPFFQHASARS
jgi:monodictyphenone polyketide synthase